MDTNITVQDKEKTVVHQEEASYACLYGSHLSNNEKSCETQLTNQLQSTGAGFSFTVQTSNVSIAATASSETKDDLNTSDTFRKERDENSISNAMAALDIGTNNNKFSQPNDELAGHGANNNFPEFSGFSNDLKDPNGEKSASVEEDEVETMESDDCSLESESVKACNILVKVPDNRSTAGTPCNKPELNIHVPSNSNESFVFHGHQHTSKPGLFEVKVEPSEGVSSNESASPKIKSLAPLSHQLEMDLYSSRVSKGTDSKINSEGLTMYESAEDRLNLSISQTNANDLVDDQSTNVKEFSKTNIGISDLSPRFNLDQTVGKEVLVTSVGTSNQTSSVLSASNFNLNTSRSEGLFLPPLSSSNSPLSYPWLNCKMSSSVSSTKNVCSITQPIAYFTNLNNDFNSTADKTKDTSIPELKEKVTEDICTSTNIAQPSEATTLLDLEDASSLSQNAYQPTDSVCSTNSISTAEILSTDKPECMKSSNLPEFAINHGFKPESIVNSSNVNKNSPHETKVSFSFPLKTEPNTSFGINSFFSNMPASKNSFTIKTPQTSTLPTFNFPINPTVTSGVPNSTTNPLDSFSFKFGTCTLSSSGSYSCSPIKPFETSKEFKFTPVVTKTTVPTAVKFSFKPSFKWPDVKTETSISYGEKSKTCDTSGNTLFTLPVTSASGFSMSDRSLPTLTLPSTHHLSAANIVPAVSDISPFEQLLKLSSTLETSTSVESTTGSSAFYSPPTFLFGTDARSVGKETGNSGNSTHTSKSFETGFQFSGSFPAKDLTKENNLFKFSPWPGYEEKSKTEIPKPEKTEFTVSSNGDKSFVFDPPSSTAATAFGSTGLFSSMPTPLWDSNPFSLPTSTASEFSFKIPSSTSNSVLFNFKGSTKKSKFQTLHPGRSTNSSQSKLRTQSVPNNIQVPFTVIKEKDTCVRNGITCTITAQHQHITAMPVYSSVSFEELRLQYEKYNCQTDYKITPVTANKRVQTSESILDGENYLAEMWKILECPVCLDIVTSPVVLCERGHHVCNHCWRRVTSCPLCKQYRSNTRNYVAEALVEKLPMPCKYRVDGCSKTMHLVDKVLHEEGCLFRTYSCLVDNCNQSYSFKDMTQHMKTSHINLIALNHFFIPKGQKYSWTMTKYSFQKVVHTFDIPRWGLFYLCHKKSGQNSYLWMQVLNTSNLDKEFLYSVEVADVQDIRSTLYKGPVLRFNAVINEQQQDYLIVPEFLLNNLTSSCGIHIKVYIWRNESVI